MIDPTCSIVFDAEPEEDDVMRRPPRPSNVKIFDRKLLMLGLQQGVVLFLVLLVVHLMSQWIGLEDGQSRALTFSAMIIGDIWLIFINRSWSLPLRAAIKLPNLALWWVVAGALAMLGMVLFLPFMITLFHFEVLPISYLLVMIVAVIGMLLITAVTGKWMYSRIR